MRTFAELGIPFPLFEGPVSTCRQLDRVGACALCGVEGHRFRVGIGGYVVTPCERCGKDRTWHVADGAAACACGGRARTPALDDRSVLACYACLRAGRALLTRDTERGMVTPELASQGLTHGLPSDMAARLDAVPSPEDPDWSRIRADPADLSELLRTPGFHTWQGDVWLFHCESPMIFVGEWKAAELLAAGGDEAGAQALLGEMVADLDDPEELFGELDHVGGLYTFRCARCAVRRATYDMD